MMTEPSLQLFDLAFRNSLWVFLGAFLVILCLIALQTRSQRQRNSEGFPGSDPTESSDSASSLGGLRGQLLLLSAQLQKALLGLLLALVLSGLFWVLSVFTPFAGLHSQSEGPSEEPFPLRLTTLSYERFHEGFSLRGEVWNQTRDPLQGVTARVQVLGSEHELLENVPVPVEPDPLPGRSPGTFQLSYTKNSPFLYGYRVTFESALGTPLLHIKGFEVD